MRKNSNGFNALCLLLALILLAGCGAVSNPPADQGENDSFESDTTKGYQESERPTETEGEPETWFERPTVVWSEDDVTAESETEAVEELSVDLNAQYIHTWEMGEYDGEEAKNAFRVIRSAGELDAYYEEYKDVYYLGRNEKVYSDTTIGFLDACDRFDEAFWAEYDLVLATKGEGSGSIRHEVVNMVSGEEGSDEDWVINFRYISPEEQTCDVAFWYFLIEVPKGMIEEDDRVSIEFTGDTDRIGLSGYNYQAVRTDNYVDSEEEKKSYYLMESRDELLVYCETHGLSDGFVEACSKYDDKFWERNKLLVVLTHDESRSIRYEAVELFKNELIDSGEWQLRVDRLLPDENLYGNEDEAALWHLLIEIPIYDYNGREMSDRIKREDEVAIVYTDKEVETKTLYNAQYIRTDPGTMEESGPIVKLICSQEELDAYYEANKNRYELVWRDWSSREQTYGFLNACERFTPLFWEQNDLVMIVLQEPNKWIRHEVESILFTEGIIQEYVITISRTSKQESDEPTIWHLLIPMPKGQVPGAEDVVLKFMEVCTESK